MAQRDHQWADTAFDTFSRALARATSRRQALKLIGASSAAAVLSQLGAAPAWAQTLVAIPGCGQAGKTKVCVSGSGFGEFSPPCRYKFLFDGVQVVVPDQPNGLFGQPARSFTVPASATPGQHKIRVELRLNSPDQLKQVAEIPFKVVSAGGASSISATGAGTSSIIITFKPPQACEDSCKKIVFIQTVRRFVVRQSDGTEVITKATDWNIATAAQKAGVETDPGRMRVDQAGQVSSPYITQNGPSLPGAGVNDGSGTVGSTEPNRHDASLSDKPKINPANFKGGFPITKVILRFLAVPFCAEGNDAGKPMGVGVTWEAHRDNSPGATVRITNINTNAGQPAPGSEFFIALDKLVLAKKFTLPKPKSVPCP
jgi:hypothetical protein